MRKLNIDPSRVVNICISDQTKLVFEVDHDYDYSTIRLHKAVQVRPGLRTKPIKQHAYLIYIKLYKTAVNDPDDEIKVELERFGEVVSIFNQTYQPKQTSSEALKAMKNIKKGDRDVVIKMQHYIPTFGAFKYSDGTVRYVKMTYPGQVKECPQCHRKERLEEDEEGQACPGRGDPNKCKEEEEEMEVPTREQAWEKWCQKAIEDTMMLTSVSLLLLPLKYMEYTFRLLSRISRSGLVGGM